MKNIKGVFTQQEILSQPDVWKETIRYIHQEIEKISQCIENPSVKNFIVVGCGSTYYLSLSAASYLRKNGFLATAYPSSEFVFFTNNISQRDHIFILISRSGTTTETLWAVEKIRKESSRSKVIVITVRPDSPLATNSDITIAAPNADEKSVVQTRSFTSMYICFQYFLDILGGEKRAFSWYEKLPGILSSLFGKYSKMMEDIGKDLRIQKFFFLGGGPYYGLACEAMLKIKELSLSWSEAYHPLELRHGPMSIVDEHSLVIGLISDRQKDAEAQVMKEMKRQGAWTLALIDSTHLMDWSSMDYVIEIGSGLDEWQRSISYLPLLQWLGFHRSLEKGLDPDNPKNLSQVIELPGEVTTWK